MSNDDEQFSNVNWKWFSILAGTVVLVGVSTYLMLPSLVSKTKSDIAIVKATKGPFKVKPTEPGGRVVDHQDLLVVDILKDGKKADEQTESLRPAAPSPEPPPVNVIENTPTKSTDKIDRTLSGIEKSKGSVVESDGMQEKSNKSSDSQLLGAPKDAVVKKTASKEKKVKKTTTSKDKKRVFVIEGEAPLYMIQLAAFRSAEKAAEMAKILSQKHRSRLKNLDLETMQVDTGSNGVFHRIVGVPLPRQDADQLCGVLRRSGQDCFIRKYTKTSP